MQMANIDLETNEKNRLAVRMLMWLYIVSMVMLFAGLTSAYLVSRAEGRWTAFSLPAVFWASTGLILASSATLWMAQKSARQALMGRLAAWLVATLVLGLCFLLAQLVGFAQLRQAGVYLSGGNAGASFLYMLPGLHGLHLVAGLVALLVFIIRALLYRIDPRNLQGLQLMATFWHALGFLWLYLFLFLLANQS